MPLAPLVEEELFAFVGELAGGVIVTVVLPSADCVIVSVLPSGKFRVIVSEVDVELEPELELELVLAAGLELAKSLIKLVLV